MRPLPELNSARYRRDESHMLLNARYIVGIVAGTVATGAMVAVTGGAPSVLVHFAYGPILLAGYAFGPAAGACTGLLAGALIGPVTSWVAPQTIGDPVLLHRTMEWSIRTAWFVAVGITSGIAFQQARDRTIALARHLGEDAQTGLPDQAAAQAHIARLRAQASAAGDSDEDPGSVSELHIANYDALVDAFGASAVARMVKELGAEARRLFGDEAFVARLRPDALGIVHGHHSRQTEEELWHNLEKLRRYRLDIDNRPVQVDRVVHRSEVGSRVSNVDASPAEPMAARATPSCDTKPQGWQTLAGQADLLVEIRRALQNNEIRVHYQPQLDLHSGRLAAAEALARWNHPTRGALMASTFIPSLDKTPLMEPFTRHVVSRVLDQLKRWHEAYYRVAIAINLDVTTLTDDSLLAFIRETVQAHDIKPRYIDIEIPESALLGADTASINTLTALRQEGFRLVVDHFGLGSSSLRYLPGLPVGALKLDHSIVQGSVRQGSDNTVLQEVVATAHKHNIKVIGDGVESSSQLAALKRLSCDYAQGFYIAKPMSAQRVQELFASGRWGPR